MELESPIPSVSRHYRWIIVSLLFLATMNNYYNRVVLSVVIPEIKKDMALDDIQYSYILSAFQFAYMFGMLAAGRFIDWIGTRLGYIIAMVVWSFSAAMHAFAGTAGALIFWRGVLGAGEAGNFPAAVKAVSEWFPVRERSFATAVFNSGPHIAVVTGAPVTAFLTLAFGWRTALLIVGLSGFVIVVLWPMVYRNPTVAADRPLGPSPSSGYTWRRLLAHRETYGIMLGKFLTDPVWWFYIFWLPNYLNSQRGLDIRQIGVAMPVVYVLAIVFGIAGGWFPGWLMRRGWSVVRARKTTMFICALCLPVTALAAVSGSLWVTILLVALACGAHSGWSNNIFTLISDRFPSEAVGSVTGLGGFAGAVGGFIFSTILVGYVVTYFGYLPIFILMASLHPLAILAVHLTVRGECGDTEAAG